MDWMHFEIVKVAGIWTRRWATARGVMKVESRLFFFLPEHGDGIPSSARFLASLVAPFGNDQELGAVSTVERVKRRGGVWEFLQAMAVELRTFENVAANTVDAGILTFPSGTAAFRTEVVKTFYFISLFMKDELVDEDAGYFLARWVFEAGYKIKIQHTADTVLEVNATSNRLREFRPQTLEEARAKWRGISAVKKGGDKYWYK